MSQITDHFVTVEGPNKDGNFNAMCSCGWEYRYGDYFPSAGWATKFDADVRGVADHVKAIVKEHTESHSGC